MRFDVGMSASPDNSQIPAALRPLPLVDLTKVKKERLLRFDYFSGSWIVNGKVFDTQSHRRRIRGKETRDLGHTQ